MPRSKPGMGGEGAGKEFSEGDSQCICQGQGDRVRLSVRFKVKVRVSVRVEALESL